MILQRTIAQNVDISGPGLHSGERVSVRFYPAAENEGIVFFRDDRKAFPIPALWSNVIDTHRATTLEHEGLRIRMVEHFLAAAFGLGITNMHVVLDNEEMPILDGSCCRYEDVLRPAGVVEQSAGRQILVPDRPLQVTSGPKHLSVTPSTDLSIDYRLFIPGCAGEHFHYDFNEDDFFPTIGRARTFATADELMTMRSRGLIQGLSEAPGFILLSPQFSIESLEGVFGRSLRSHLYEISSGFVLSAEKPRYAEEAVRHKILDLIGDLALSGTSVRGRFEAHGTGHTDNVALLRKIMESAGRKFRTTN